MQSYESRPPLRSERQGRRLETASLIAGFAGIEKLMYSQLFQTSSASAISTANSAGAAMLNSTGSILAIAAVG
jgi:hypothetical protein